MPMLVLFPPPAPSRYDLQTRQSLVLPLLVLSQKRVSLPPSLLLQLEQAGAKTLKNALLQRKSNR